MRLILSLVLVILFSVISFSQQQLLDLKGGELNQDAFNLTEDSVGEAQAVSQPFPARGGDIDWGLALSGGGIRSGYFSIGALKALYDKGYLDDIDVISSVSGGGYASYWLYTNFQKDYKSLGKAAHFGEAAFDDKKFIQNICQLQDKRKAAFVPTISLLKIIFNFRGRAFKRYKQAIETTFGNDQPSDTPLGFLNPAINDGIAPYFIVNTTLRMKGDDKKNPSRRLFEITPYFRGNPYLEYRDWAAGDKTPTLSESIASSAAPRWKIAHPIENYLPRVVNRKKLYLSDGGHIENLAAFTLIRRGVKNIIIVDAEEDAAYQFEGYGILKKFLIEKLDINLNIRAIDEFIEQHRRNKKRIVFPNSISIGTAESKPDVNGKVRVRSNIYYLKMTLPESLFPTGDISGAEKERRFKIFADGIKLNEERKAQLNKNTRCEDLKFNFEENKSLYTDLYTFRVRDYAEFLNNPSRRKNFGLWTKLKFFNTLGRVIPFLTYKFPHITTVDQSFFSDQAEAFVGLGYLQASELPPIQEIQPAVR